MNTTDIPVMTSYPSARQMGIQTAAKGIVPSSIAGNPPMKRKKTIIPINTSLLCFSPSFLDSVMTAAFKAPVLFTRPIAAPIVKIMVIKAAPSWIPWGMDWNNPIKPTGEDSTY